MILFNLETILTEKHSFCLRGVIRFFCIILSTVFPWVKLKIIVITGKQLYSPHLPSKNFRTINKDLFLSNLHFFAFVFMNSQDFFPSLTVVACVFRQFEASVTMYGVHCKMSFNALM